MIWFVFTLMAGIAWAVVASPLIMRKSLGAATGDRTGAVLVDQLDEVGRDLDHGLISKGEAEAAQVEIKRRILALSRRNGAQRQSDPGSGRRVLLLSALLVPAFATGYYVWNGSPSVPSLAFAERQAERDTDRDVAELTGRLLERLRTDPEGGPSEGWMLLGQTYMRIGRYTEAADAYRVVAGRDDANSATFSRLAEAIISAENGVVTPGAETAIERALALDPDNLAGVYYKSLALSQTGDEVAAFDLLAARIEAAEGPAPWIAPFIAEANRLAARIGRDPVTGPAPAAPPGPSAADVSAAGEMTEEERSAFIRSMVDRLAARLQDQPDDLEGWMRLGNAYRVLEDPKNALAAYRQAEALLQSASETDPRLIAVRSALSELDPSR